MPWFSNIEVHYGTEQSQAPPGRLLEIKGGNDDINAGFGGKYVWLVPVKTNVHADALSSLSIAIQSKEDPTKQDLAAGAGGDYRYIVLALRDPAKITALGLLRSSDPREVPEGWNGSTEDINKGRKGDYLYLVWKSE
ncbi:uncharacterized protein FIBRA_08496 [Fibroporia radiculosa]|uniref:MABP domain-containing protein n=1 Tax=Fibroporia radiculosa TaxID=599839 RepID=J4I2U8_9APHY|nr:uncharacterized protein FIBRA_08496 [Fibroporia radiculosa]CCM06247.1 predicted protein [Fibroporia radiculosa]